MELKPRSGLHTVLLVALLFSGCQPVLPIAVPTIVSTQPISTPEALPSATPTSPPTLALTPTLTWQLTPSATPKPVYTPITSQNAGRLLEVAVLDFGPWSQILSLEWAPDGSLLAVAAGNKIILVEPHTWSVAAQVDLVAAAAGLAFSPDSQHLAAAHRDGSLSVWDISLENGAQLSPVFTLEAHRKGANQVVFSPDGLWLASGGNDALARVWQVRGGEAVAQIIGGSYAVADLAFSPDGAWLAIVNGNLIRLRKPDSGIMGLTLQAQEPIYRLAYSPDGRWLAGGDTANQVLLWEIGEDVSGRVAGEHTGQPGRVNALIWQVEFHPQGDLLVSAGGDGTVRLWDLISNQALMVLSGHGGAATSATFSPDGLWLASGDLDGRLHIWGLQD